MSDSREQFARRLLSGQQTGLRAAALRTLLSCAEPFYASAMRLRNTLYDLHLLRAHPLPRPTVSIGNITTGGTGKTPVVHALASHLRAAGLHPAILLRGYKQSSGLSDEAALLHNLLNTPGQSPIPVHPNPDRVAAATAALRDHPDIDCFLLDDAFQHRRAARDFNLVLINALDPFGYNHVLPRGLLREPLAGLARAHAFLLTHADQAQPNTLSQIEQTLRRHNPAAPIYRASHAHTALQSDDSTQPLSSLQGKCAFAFCGIGSPESFLDQLRQLPLQLVGHHIFADHHPYTPDDLARLSRAARTIGAPLLLTTEKDWVKIAPLARAPDLLPIARLTLGIRFHDDHESRLFSAITQVIKRK